MTQLIHRRSLLRGLFTAPAVVAASSLMPLRGVIMPIDYEGWRIVTDSDLSFRLDDLSLSGVIECADHENCWLLDEPPVLKNISVDGIKYRETLDDLIERYRKELGLHG
jgi:hypothetical protein